MIDLFNPNEATIVTREEMSRNINAAKDVKKAKLQSGDTSATLLLQEEASRRDPVERIVHEVALRLAKQEVGGASPTQDSVESPKKKSDKIKYARAKANVGRILHDIDKSIYSRDVNKIKSLVGDLADVTREGSIRVQENPSVQSILHDLDEAIDRSDMEQIKNLTNQITQSTEGPFDTLCEVGVANKIKRGKIRSAIDAACDERNFVRMKKHTLDFLNISRD